MNGDGSRSWHCTFQASQYPPSLSQKHFCCRHTGALFTSRHSDGARIGLKHLFGRDSSFQEQPADTQSTEVFCSWHGVWSAAHRRSDASHRQLSRPWHPSTVVTSLHCGGRKQCTFLVSYAQPCRMHREADAFSCPQRVK